MPGDKKREPFAPGPRIMYYGGASYEKSQVLYGLRQLAQRGHISAADGPGCSPSLPPPPLVALLSGAGPGVRVRGAGVDEEIVFYLCRFFSLGKREKAAQKEKLIRDNSLDCDNNVSQSKFFWGAVKKVCHSEPKAKNL